MDIPGGKTDFLSWRLSTLSMIIYKNFAAWEPQERKSCVSSFAGGCFVIPIAVFVVDFVRQATQLGAQ